MDRGAWWAAVHRVGKSRIWLSDFTFTFHFHVLEKETATHSGVLAWRIPGTGEPGGLPSMGSHRVGHDWSDLAAAAVTPVHSTFVLCCDRYHRALCFSRSFEPVNIRSIYKGGLVVVLQLYVLKGGIWDLAVFMFIFSFHPSHLSPDFTTTFQKTWLF